MKTHVVLIITLTAGLVSISAFAKRPPTEEYRFDAAISGAVNGGGTSNLTAIRGNIRNLVFNKSGWGGYNLSSYFDDVSYDQGDGIGSECFGDGITGTMQLYDDSWADGLMARFWFRAKSSDGLNEINYVLALFDTDWNATGPTWDSSFPPLANDLIITRTAESWAIETTKKKVKNPCTGTGDFDDNSYVTVGLECSTCE